MVGEEACGVRRLDRQSMSHPTGRASRRLAAVSVRVARGLHPQGFIAANSLGGPLAETPQDSKCWFWPLYLRSGAETGLRAASGPSEPALLRSLSRGSESGRTLSHSACSSSEARASRASVSVPALLATRSLACGLGWRRRWVAVCGDRRWPGAERHSGSAAMPALFVSYTRV